MKKLTMAIIFLSIMVGTISNANDIKFIEAQANYLCKISSVINLANNKTMKKIEDGVTLLITPSKSNTIVLSFFDTKTRSAKMGPELFPLPNTNNHLFEDKEKQIVLSIENTDFQNKSVMVQWAPLLGTPLMMKTDKCVKQ